MKCQRVGCSARAEIVVADGGRALAVCDHCAVVMRPDSIFVDLDPTTDGLAEARDLLAAGQSQPAPTEAPASTDPAVSPPTEVSPTPPVDLEPTPVVIPEIHPMPVCRVPGCPAEKIKSTGLCATHYNRAYGRYVASEGGTTARIADLSTEELATLDVVKSVTKRPTGQSKQRQDDVAAGLMPQPATHRPPLRIRLTTDDIQRRMDCLDAIRNLPMRDELASIFPAMLVAKAELFVDDLRRQLETEALEVDVDAAKAA